MSNQAIVASALTSGDQFVRNANGLDTPDDIVITVLRNAEATEDRFGRPAVKVWCKREDTGQEGWMPFGPDALIALHY